MSDRKENKLTPKQEMFCREYLLDLNATQAAIRAGYSSKSADVEGSRLLVNAKVKALITELQANRSDKLEIDAKWVLQRFKDISDRCMTAEPVMIKDEEGNWVESGVYQFDSGGANKATENIGKHIGFFEKDNSQLKASLLLPKTLSIEIIPPPKE